MPFLLHRYRSGCLHLVNASPHATRPFPTPTCHWHVDSWVLNVGCTYLYPSGCGHTGFSVAAIFWFLLMLPSGCTPALVAARTARLPHTARCGRLIHTFYITHTMTPVTPRAAVPTLQPPYLHLAVPLMNNDNEHRTNGNLSFSRRFS